MTQEEAGRLPDYVAASAPDAARDDERLNVSLFAPTGGNITDLTVEGAQFGLGAATWHGIPFYSGTVDLHAGETTTITYTLTTSAEAGTSRLRCVRLLHARRLATARRRRVFLVAQIIEYHFGADRQSVRPYFVRRAHEVLWHRRLSR